MQTWASKAYSTARRLATVVLTAKQRLRLLDGAVDEQLKKLMKELGEAINQAVAESDRVADVMGRMKASGHDVFLALEATIGFTADTGTTQSTPPRAANSPGELEITSQDLQFLRSLRIAVNDQK